MINKKVFHYCSMFLFTILFFIATKLPAQTTIESDDFPSLVGTYIITEDDTVDTVEVDVGLPGENRIWSFNYPYRSEFTRQLIVEKSNAPFSSNFPDANMVTRYGGKLGYLIHSYYFENAQGLFYSYQKKTSDSLVIQGIGVDSANVSFDIFTFRHSGAVDIEPDLLFSTFPVRYGDSLETVSKFSVQIDTLLFGSWVTLLADIKDSINCIVDGWGTIILPSASYECLRIKSYITLNENLYINGELFSSKTTRTINYYWLARDYGIVAKIISHPNETDDNFTRAKQVSRLHLFNPVLEFSMPDTIAVPEDTVILPICVTDLTDLNISDIQIQLACDTAVLKPIDVVTNESMAGSWENMNYALSDSSITLDLWGENPLTGSGILCFVRFLINQNPQGNDSSYILFKNVEVQEQGPTIITKPGLVKVALVFDITGNVNYYSNDLPISNVQISLNERNTSSNSDGKFSFRHILPGSYDLVPIKDGELKNSISAFDASMILRYVVGLISLTPYQMVAADVTGNGSISTLDASYILRYSVGLITEFPTGDVWRFVPTAFIINEQNWFLAPDRIRYDSLDSDHIYQNIKGMIYGDVSGNWSNIHYVAREFSGEATVQLGEFDFISEIEFIVPIDIASDAEILSLYFEITYCSQDIEFSNLEFNSVSGECFADFEEDKENLKISIASTHPWNGKDNRIGLKFKKKDSDSKRKTTIKLSRVSLNENLVKINIMDSESSLEPSKPDHLTLSQNYPNPFNSFTSISYQIPKSCHVTLQIYNTLGQLINTLLDSDHETGTYHVQWDGKSNQNRDVPSGVYFYCLKTSNEKVIARINQKMILIR